MVKSLFNYIQPHITEDNRIENLKKLLQETGNDRYFDGVWIDYGQNAYLITTYILFAYLNDSTYVTGGEDWLNVKLGIMELVGLHAPDFEEVIRLKKQSVKDAINGICEIAKDWRYRQLIIWKESSALLDEIAITAPPKDQKGSSKNISDAAKFSFDLKRKISDLEKEILQTSRSIERTKEVQALNLENISMESILKSLS